MPCVPVIGCHAYDLLPIWGIVLCVPRLAIVVLVVCQFCGRGQNRGPWNDARGMFVVPKLFVGLATRNPQSWSFDLSCLQPDR